MLRLSKSPQTPDTPIRALRESTGESQTEFCERFGIPRRTLQSWESGDRTSPDWVIRLIAFAVENNYSIKTVKVEKGKISSS